MIPPPAAAVARFAADLGVLAPDLADAPLALAVSGGPDSMAMLALAAAIRPGGVIAATVDHRLRSESTAEAVLVAGVCDTLGVQHATLPIDVPPGASGNLQSWARRERYALLRRWASGHAAPLLTAHHADDQAETFLMRAARASGLSGLAGVRARTDDTAPSRELSRIETGQDGVPSTVDRWPVTLLRPLLGWRRAELRAIVDAAGLPVIIDPSNVDRRFDRTRVREWLSQAPWFDAVQVKRSTDHLAEAEGDLLAVSRLLWNERARPAGDEAICFDVAGVPRGVRRHLACMAIDALTTHHRAPLDGHLQVGNVEHLLDSLEAGRNGTHRDVIVVPKGDLWTFREAPPRRLV